MSFSSNIFENLPLVHTLNPDFLGQQLWLCFSPGSWMSSRETPEFGLQQIPELAFTSPPVRACPRAQLPNLALDRFPNRPSSDVLAIDSSRLRASACSWPHFFTESRSPNFAHSRIRGSTGSRLPKIVNSLPPEKHVSRTLLNSTFRGWRVFLNSPTDLLWIRPLCPCFPT
jgi:hypothetical protein